MRRLFTRKPPVTAETAPLRCRLASLVHTSALLGSGLSLPCEVGELRCSML
jgi:hypothetical protein